MPKLSSARCPEDLLKIYKSLDSSDRSQLWVYQSALKKFRDFGEPKRVIPLWVDMKNHEIVIDSIFLSSYLKACCESREFKAGLAAFRSLPASFIPDRGAILSLALLVREAKYTHIIPDVLQLSSKFSIKLDQVIMGCFSVACMETDDVTTTEFIISFLIKSSNVQLNAVICNQFMQTFRNAQKMFRAVKVLDIFTSYKIPPTSSTYRILLSGCIDEKLLYLGLKVHDKLMKSGLEIDASIFSLLLKLLSRTGRIEHMLSLWQKFQDKEYQT
jgi:hypothetical protein